MKTLLFFLCCLCALSLSAQNLIKNSGFDDDSEWKVTSHLENSVSDVVFGYAEETPSQGAGPCLYVSAFDAQEARPVIYQKFTAVAGEMYRVTGAIKIINQDLPEPTPPGTWFQIYINPEEPPDWYDGMGDWNPSTKLLNWNVWDCQDKDWTKVDGFWEHISCANDWGDNLPYFVPEGEPGTPVDLYLVMKPGLWLNPGTLGSFEVVIDNVGVFPVSSNLIKNWGFDDDSEWKVTSHLENPVSDVVFGYAEDKPSKGIGPCLYVSAFDAQEARPVIYQKFTAVAGEMYRVTGAIKIINQDLPEPTPPGTWFQIYINPEEPPDWYDGMGDWNPSTKLLNWNVWDCQDKDWTKVDGFWEHISCANDWGDNLPYFVPEGEPGTPVDLYLVMKPGLWLNPGTLGSFEVVIDNVGVFPVTEAGMISKVADRSLAPSHFVLEQNYPNPFNPQAAVSFQLPKKEAVTLEVFNLRGQKVATLINHEVTAPGRHTVTFNGAGLTSGIYLYRLQVNGFSEVKKMVLQK